jgi:hypothetical protein
MSPARVIIRNWKEVTTMNHEHETGSRLDWQTPECEQISVSAEVTGYMGTSTDRK